MTCEKTSCPEYIGLSFPAGKAKWYCRIQVDAGQFSLQLKDIEPVAKISLRNNGTAVIIHSNIAIPADHQSAIISEPGESSLNFPAAFITSQLATIMVLLLLIVAPIGANQFNASRSQTLSKRVAVITFVSNQQLRPFSWTTSAISWSYPMPRNSCLSSSGFSSGERR